MNDLSKSFKVKEGTPYEDFMKELNKNAAIMFTENGADPSDYVWSYERGLLNDDFVNDQTTCIIKAHHIK